MYTLYSAAHVRYSNYPKPQIRIHITQNISHIQVILAVILIWQFAKFCEDHGIKCAPFVLQAWVSFHRLQT